MEKHTIDYLGPVAIIQPVGNITANGLNIQHIRVSHKFRRNADATSQVNFRIEPVDKQIGGGFIFWGFTSWNTINTVLPLDEVVEHEHVFGNPLGVITMSSIRPLLTGQDIICSVGYGSALNLIDTGVKVVVNMTKTDTGGTSGMGTVTLHKFELYQEKKEKKGGVDLKSTHNAGSICSVHSLNHSR